MTLTYNGADWRLIGRPVRTSDGYLLGTAELLDDETGEPVLDEMGLPVIHTFFLGEAR